MGYTKNAQEESSKKITGHCREDAKVWRIEIPVHITGVWIPIWHRDPLRAGSLGAGLLLEPGVKAIVRYCPGEEGSERSQTLIYIEGEPLQDSLKNIEIACEEAGFSIPGSSIEIYSPLPLGVGYAVSAAIVLAYTVSHALLGSTKRLSLEEAAKIAHVAEVKAGTGLGDVIAEYEGRMLEVRLAPGAPGIGKIESYSVDVDTIITTAFRKMSTQDMHRTMLRKIYEAGGKAYARIIEEPSLDNFLEQANKFSRLVGFMDRNLEELLDNMVKQNYIRGWYAKKGVAVIIPERGLEQEIIQKLRSIRPQLKAFIHRVSGSPLGVERIA